MYLFNAGGIAVRRMENTVADKTLLLEWLTNPAVTRWAYGENAPWDMAKLEKGFGPKLTGSENMTPCIMEYTGEAVGYLQFYPLEKDSYAFTQEVPYEKVAGGYGMDIFIGQPALWGKGIGSMTVGAAAEYVFCRRKARLVCADPGEKNQRSVACFQKAGFVPLGRIPDYDDPLSVSILMAKYG